MRCGWLNAAATATGIGRHAPERSRFAFRSCARAAISQASSNRIKECQLDLYADRTSAHTMRANQLRLWFASLAYVLIGALRGVGLAHTRLADATCGTIRLKLLKIGAQVRVSVRRIKVAMASACPYAEEFALAHARRCGPMMPPDLNPPTNEKGYITGPDKTPHRGDGRASSPASPAPTAANSPTSTKATGAVRDAG
jgi:hypothetical protein